MIRTSVRTLRKIIKEEVARAISEANPPPIPSQAKKRSGPPPVPPQAFNKPEDVVMAYLSGKNSKIDDFDASRALDKLKSRLDKKDFDDVRHAIIVVSHGFEQDDFDINRIRNILHKK